jgi:hypothetical protein
MNSDPTSPGFVSLKELCSDFPQNSDLDAKWPSFPQVVKINLKSRIFTKHDISENAYGHFDFPAVGENIYKIRTSINQPLAGRKRRG